MKAIIMAGGRGERLRPITDTIPKPMIDINGKTVLEHILNLFKQFGISDFIFSVCYLPQAITSYFGDGSKFGIHIDYLIEDQNKPMGTAGGIALAKKYIDEDIIPEDYLDDALHIAIAILYQIDILVSWNFKHLVNPVTRRGINAINMLKGYKQVDIVSPEELGGDKYE